MKSFFSLFLLFVNLNPAFAHGENKLGPHEGYIRMPAAFHTELVPGVKNTFNVYLMDVGNSNPVIKDSSVQLKYQNKKMAIHFKCTPIADHFNCIPNEKINALKGTLILNAIRINNKSKDAVYELPLKLAAPMKD